MIQNNLTKIHVATPIWKQAILAAQSYSILFFLVPPPKSIELFVWCSPQESIRSFDWSASATGQQRSGNYQLIATEREREFQFHVSCCLSTVGRTQPTPHCSPQLIRYRRPQLQAIITQPVIISIWSTSLTRRSCLLIKITAPRPSVLLFSSNGTQRHVACF